MAFNFVIRLVFITFFYMLGLFFWMLTLHSPFLALHDFRPCFNSPKITPQNYAAQGVQHSSLVAHWLTVPRDNGSIFFIYYENFSGNWQLAKLLWQNFFGNFYLGNETRAAVLTISSMGSMYWSDWFVGRRNRFYSIGSIWTDHHTSTTNYALTAQN